MIQKELIFPCYCSTENQFKSRDWNATDSKSDPHDSTEVKVSSKCPKCGIYSHIYYGLSDLFYMLMLEEVEL